MGIVATDISKSYPPSGAAPPARALDRVSFSAAPGSITGLAGPNGSGKTTLLKILSGLLPHDGGRFTLCGLASPEEYDRVRTIAAFAEARPGSFYMRLSAAENLEFFGALYGLSKEQVSERGAALADALCIPGSARAERFDRLSAGTGQKFSLVRALMRDSRVLLLDEPAKGLDAASTAALRGLLRRLAEEGRTIICASHDLRELAETSDRTLFLRNGKLAAEIPGAELRKAAAQGGGALEKLFAEAA